MYDKIKRILALATAYSRQDGLPIWRQVVEMTWLLLVRRIGPSYYMLGRFWRRAMPFKDKLAHLNEVQYQRHVDHLNPAEYRKISQHKVSEKAMLTLLGFRTPRFLGYYHPQRGRDCEGRPLRNAADLAKLLQGCQERRVCFKLVEGWGGSEFKAMDVILQSGGPLLVDRELSETIDPATFAGRLTSPDGYLVEAYLEQHPVLAALNSSSLNTVRMWVVLGPEGGSVAGAFLRVGRAGSVVDSTSRGGLACPVDLSSGALLSADVVSIERPSFATHPDTHVPVRGVVLPHWEACKQLAIESLAAFPNMKFAGLDIAIGRDGPWIIELNTYPDKSGATIFDIPTAHALSLSRSPARGH